LFSITLLTPIQKGLKDTKNMTDWQQNRLKALLLNIINDCLAEGRLVIVIAALLEIPASQY
jgi:hypothetical protein